VFKQVVLQGIGHQRALFDNLNLRGEAASNHRSQQGEVGAGQQDGVHGRFALVQEIHAFLYSELCYRAIQFAFFDKRHPEGAGLLV
jgi:hypothetical protein